MTNEESLDTSTWAPLLFCPSSLSLGSAKITAALREVGHLVNIIDLSFCMNSKPSHRKAKPDAVSISCITRVVSDAPKAGELVRRSLNCPTVVCGPHRIILPYDLMEKTPVTAKKRRGFDCS